ncbi:MAG TPA: DUF309 domain-containing protein [Coleofasciculaceae cyanobacterium]
MTDQPAEFWLAITQFNQGHFYDCHDTLEALWIEATEPDKAFYQGILQLAVAFYHLGNDNWRGAVTLLGEGLGRLSRYPEVYAEIQVDQLIQGAAAILKHLQQGGPEQVTQVRQDLGYGTQTASSLEAEPKTLRLPKICETFPAGEERL